MFYLSDLSSHSVAVCLKSEAFILNTVFSGPGSEHIIDLLRVFLMSGKFDCTP